MGVRCPVSRCHTVWTCGVRVSNARGPVCQPRAPRAPQRWNQTEHTMGDYGSLPVTKNGHWAIGQEERRWDCYPNSAVYGAPSGTGESPTDVRVWKYTNGRHWLFGPNIHCQAGRHGPYASLQIAVGKEAAPGVVAMGSVATLALFGRGFGLGAEACAIIGSRPAPVATRARCAGRIREQCCR